MAGIAPPNGRCGGPVERGAAARAAPGRATQPQWNVPLYVNDDAPTTKSRFACTSAVLSARLIDSPWPVPTPAVVWPTNLTGTVPDPQPSAVPVKSTNVFDSELPSGWTIIRPVWTNVPVNVPVTVPVFVNSTIVFPPGVVRALVTVGGEAAPAPFAGCGVP